MGVGWCGGGARGGGSGYSWACQLELGTTDQRACFATVYTKDAVKK